MVASSLIFAVVMGQGRMKPPLPPPVVGVWVLESARRAGPLPAGYRLSVSKDGNWVESPPRRSGQWKFRNGVLTLRIMRGEDLWSVERTFLLGKDGRLSLSGDRPVRLVKR